MPQRRRTPAATKEAVRLAFLAIATMDEAEFRARYRGRKPAGGGPVRDGWTDADIASLAGVSPDTIRRHRKSVLATFTADAVNALLAREAGFAGRQRQVYEERRRKEQEAREWLSRVGRIKTSRTWREWELTLSAAYETGF
jgi:hypothetical protein